MHHHFAKINFWQDFWTYPTRLIPRNQSSNQSIMGDILPYITSLRCLVFCSRWVEGFFGFFFILFSASSCSLLVWQQSSIWLLVRIAFLHPSIFNYNFIGNRGGYLVLNLGFLKCSLELYLGLLILLHICSCWISICSYLVI